MGKYELPTTEKYLTNLYNSLFEQIYKGHDVNFLGLKETGKAGLTKFLLFQPEAQQFRDKLTNTTHIFIDETAFEDEITYWRSMYRQLFGKDEELEMLTYFNAITEKIYSHTRYENNYLVIFHNQMPKWRFLSKEFNNRLFLLKRIFEERVLFVNILDAGAVYDDELFNQFTKVLQLKDVYFPVYNLEETAYQIDRNRYLADQNNPEESNQQVADRVHKFSGGIGGLTKRLSKLANSDLLSQTTKEILANNATIKNEVAFIFEDMDPEWIKAVANKDYIEEMSLAGLIGENRQVQSELLDVYLQDFEIKPNSNIPLELVLTQQELDVYKLLEEKKGEIVDRESIAKAMWGEEYLEKYSEWGIDSVISRIRKKLPQLSIKTIRGRGTGLLDEKQHRY